MKITRSAFIDLMGILPHTEADCVRIYSPVNGNLLLEYVFVDGPVFVDDHRVTEEIEALENLFKLE